MVASFFPRMYPDETLHSMIGRYHLRSGNANILKSLEDLFSHVIEVSVDLPSGIEKIISALPESSRITAEELVFNHTAFLFYTNFLPSERANEIYNGMLNSKGGYVHYKSGIMGSSILLNKHLRYCPLCSREDLSSYREMYWHRMHQFPGIEICTKHNTWLQDSKVPIVTHNKYDIQVATEENCDLNHITIVEDPDIKEKFQIFFNNAEKVATTNFQNRSFEWFTNLYRNRLMELGYINIRGNVDQEKLKKAFVNYYGEEFLELLQSPIIGEHSWLSYMVRKPKKSIHPIRHLLLIEFLGLKIEDVFEQKYEFLPFAKAPYPCLNPACEHYKKDIIETVQVDICDKTREPIGIFTCQCGFTYSRRGFQKSEEDRYKISRVKDFGQVWKNELIKLLNQNLSIREIGRRLHCDGKTVKRYANSIEVNTVRKLTITTEKFELYRNRWLEAQKKHPNKSKSQLRKVESKAYSWLYEHDREWLNSNSPKPKRVIVSEDRVDWEARDQEILEEAKIGVQKILNIEGRPQRLTITRIGTEIGRLALLQKKMNKLPLTKAYLDTVTESIEQFRQRKIEWAIKELERQGEEIRTWKVQRMLGSHVEVSREMLER